MRIATSVLVLILLQAPTIPRIATAQGDVLKVEVMGTVVLYNDFYCQCIVGVEIGSPINGYYIYDLAALDDDPDSSVGLYEWNSAPTEMVLSVGEHEFRTDPAAPEFTVIVHDSVVDSNGPHDMLLVADENPYDVVHNVRPWFMKVELTDGSATSLSTDELPGAAPLLESWPNRLIDIVGDFRIMATLDSVVTVVSQVESQSVPGLKPDVVCYPNPASGMATVVIGLSAASTVTADVWSVTGRRVGVLTRNQRLPAGTATLEWNGTDARGRRIPSGVYFVRVTAGGATAITRVVLVR